MTGEMTGEFSELLLGLCAGALLAMAAAMLRSQRLSARWSGFLFFLSSAFFAAKLWGDATGAFPMAVQSGINVVAMSSVGWFWLMVMSLFADCDEYRPIMFAAPASVVSSSLPFARSLIGSERISSRRSVKLVPCPLFAIGIGGTAFVLTVHDSALCSLPCP